MSAGGRSDRGAGLFVVQQMEERLNTQNDLSEVLEVASEAGHILLENGAEIARIEETMERISTHFGVTSKNFFVLSNGIFTTGKSTSVKSQYANVEFIPIKGTQMDKIVEVNTLSRDVEAGKYSVAQAREKLSQIRAMKPKPAWEQVLGSAFGSAGFCAIFGGSLMDCGACFLVGLLLWAFVLFISSGHFSKLLENLLNGAFASLMCFLLWKTGFGDNLGNMIVGSLIPLIPGVTFTNGIRDIAGEDYLAGVTRLLDALLVFLAITVGACFVFFFTGHLQGGMILLHGAQSDPFTAQIWFQLIAAFIGTVGFSVLFGTPRKEYLPCGIIGTIAWALFIILWKKAGLSFFEATLVSSLVTTFLARQEAVIRRCPNTVYLITGLFPLIPGGGVFWTVYYMASRQFHQALQSGVLALSVAFAIVLGIVLVSGIPRHFKWKWHFKSITDKTSASK